jgi:cellulose synthase/poly-beta-1,6-N-acetylglucosamine synthase-like glycosyltransferase
MHAVWLVLFSLIALFWLTYGLKTMLGARRLPWLRDFAPAPDSRCPKISLIFAARDEEEKLPHALPTLAGIDYPNLEILAVDDRSTDATPRILDEFAAAHPRFHALHVADLPSGWLGKPHALDTAYRASTGEWLLFTDADVKFQPDALRRCVTFIQEKQLDHLTLFGDVEMSGFWDRALIPFFGMAFQLAIQPQSVADPTSRSYVGVGAFQMVRRSAYESSGTHRRLAMEVLDDVKLGKIVKLGGFRSAVAVAQAAVSVRWHAGFTNLVRGVEKNFFAGAGFSLPSALAQIFALLAFHVFPLLALLFGHGWIRVIAGVGFLIPLMFQAAVDYVMRVPLFYALTFPLSATMFAFMLARSTFLALSRRGIFWRGTFYPLDELRRGIV